LVSLAAAIAAWQLAVPQQGTPTNGAHPRNAPIPPDYVCLNETVKATAPDGTSVFVSMQVKPGECESAVIPSPLSREDRNLLYRMSVDASNVASLYVADELRETGSQKRTWTSMIEMGVKNCSTGANAALR
jgi:hypothetical protein